MFPNERILITELADRRWFPKWLKGAYHNAMGFILKCGNYYRHFPCHLNLLLEKTGSDEVYDFGTGSALHVQLAVAKFLLPPRKMHITDLDPQADQLESLAGKNDIVDFIRRSVDMTDYQPPVNRQVATVCSSFHHLSDAQAAAAIKNFGKSFSGVLICEPFERSWFHFFRQMLLFFPGIFVGILSPFFHKMTATNLLFCTILPLAPLAVQIDGLLSVLRSFKYDEIAELMRAEGIQPIQFDYGFIGLIPKPAVIARFSKTEGA